jgi:carbon monoxide dehydrogenase subunit G
VTTFEARNQSDADVPAPRDKIWTAVSAPQCLAQLTPMVAGITVSGDRWCWQLRSLSIMGARVQPSFTEVMSLEDGRRIAFEHRPPPGTSERGGANGTYLLEDLPGGGTHLAVDITLQVDLPLPGISRHAVQAVMASMMARTGDKFAANLLAHLGVEAKHASTSARR